MNFTQFHLHPCIVYGIDLIGYSKPTPIQRESIPHVMTGRDVVGIAQTGTGKTAAFVLPILNRLMDGPRKRIRALVLAPTRELTEQTDKAILQLGCKTGLKSMSLYGGVGIQTQIRDLARGVDIVAACPGRLLDHIQRKTIDLNAIQILVIDEADRLFDMGFLPDVRKIIALLPANRQTLLFSATMPEDIRRLSREILRNPVSVQTEPAIPSATVSHTFYPVKMVLKNQLLKEILNTRDTGSVLVFTRTKMRSKRVARQLSESGFKAAELHGNLSQNQRQKALDGFRSGRVKILVATDVASRGIDVKGISHVINFDVPDTIDAYTHRIGRTGRANETGEAFTFVSLEEKDMATSIGRILGDKLKYCNKQEFANVVSVTTPTTVVRHKFPVRSNSSRPAPGSWRTMRSDAGRRQS